MLRKPSGFGKGRIGQVRKENKKARETHRKRQGRGKMEHKQGITSQKTDSNGG